MPVPPDGTLQVTHFGELEGFPWRVIQHVLTSPGDEPDPTDLNTVCEGIRSAATNMLTNDQSSNLVYEGVLGTLWAAGGTEYSGSALNPVIGGEPSSPSTLAASIVVSWRTHTTWRGGKPRSYFPGVPESRVADGRQLDSGIVAAIQGRVDSFLAAIPDITTDTVSCESLVCLRRFADGGSTTTPPTPLDPPELVVITAAVVRSVLGTQRRRMHRNG
jgi:hypothetical protein